MADKGTLGIGFHFEDLAVGDTFRTTHRTLFEAVASSLTASS